jgi:hypothetical protein
MTAVRYLNLALAQSTPPYARVLSEYRPGTDAAQCVVEIAE